MKLLGYEVTIEKKFEHEEGKSYANGETIFSQFLDEIDLIRIIKAVNQMGTEDEA